MQGGLKMGASKVSGRKILGPRPLPVGVSFKICHCATFALLKKFVFYMFFIIGMKIFNSVSNQHKRKGHCNSQNIDTSSFNLVGLVSLLQRSLLIFMRAKLLSRASDIVDQQVVFISLSWLSLSHDVSGRVKAMWRSICKLGN